MNGGPDGMDPVDEPQVRGDHADLTGPGLGGDAAYDLVIGRVTSRARCMCHLDHGRVDRRSWWLLEDDDDILSSRGDPLLEQVHEIHHRAVAILPPCVWARADHVHPVHEPPHGLQPSLSWP